MDLRMDTLVLCTLLFLTISISAEPFRLNNVPALPPARIRRSNIPPAYPIPDSAGPSPGSPPLPIDAAQDDLNLLDIVLVASVDGKFHAINRTTGRQKWSMSDDPTFGAGIDDSGNGNNSTDTPLPILQHLVRTDHKAITQPDIHDEDTVMDETYIIEPQSGDIYVLPSSSTPSTPLQRLPFTMSQLVEHSPFSFPGDDQRVFVGRKETSLISLDIETGRIVGVFNSDQCIWDDSPPPLRDHEDNDAGAEWSEEQSNSTNGGKKRSRRRKVREIHIGRTDYHVAVHVRGRGNVQNLAFSTYGPNNIDRSQQTLWSRTPDDLYLQTLPDGTILSFKTDTDEKLQWITKLTQPAVAVFDILTTPSRSTPFVLLQPRPHLNRLFPDRASLSDLPDSTYVGLVGSSLFAMSHLNYPFVRFPEVRKGWKKGQHGNPKMTIGEGKGEGEPQNRDVPMPMGADTSEERCADLDCFVGVRISEMAGETRHWRLLDGPVRLGIDAGSESEVQTGTDPSGHGQHPHNAHHSVVIPHPTHSSSAPPYVPALPIPSEVRPALGSGPFGLGFGVGGEWEWGQVVFALAIGGLVTLISLGWFGVRVKFGRRGVESVKGGANDGQRFEEALVVSSLRNSTVINAGDPSAAPSSAAIPMPASDPTTLATPLVDVDIAIEDDPNGGSAAVKNGGDDAEGDSGAEGDDAAGKKKRRRKRGRGKKGGAKEDKAAPEDAVVAPGGAAAAELLDGFVKVEKAEQEDVGVAERSRTPSPRGSISIVSSKKEQAPVSSLVVSDTILGFGSHGTMVFEGSFQGRAVAVKRLLQDFVTLASREVSLLQESDDHPNVIRYYYKEFKDNFLYIALELCPASLADIVERPTAFPDISPSFDPKRALAQITAGLGHLHSLKIVHRDIKPPNILISRRGKNGATRMLISDFGLCKKLESDQTSFLPTAQGSMGAGTVGWRAPEILRGEVKLDEQLDASSGGIRGNGSGDGSIGSSVGGSGAPGTTSATNPTRLTKSVDIFALGILFYYTITGGEHPYGDRFEREVNILRDAKSLEWLERLGEEGSEATDVIYRMLNPEPKLRPDTTACLTHPFFWTPARRLAFLQDASDRFEIMERDPREPPLVELESQAFQVVGPDWHRRLDKIFIDNLGKFRKYDGKSVQDLLRALRNKKHHYQDLPDNVKRHLGPLPEGFLGYFTRRFPKLFLHVYFVISNSSLRYESMFRSYYDLVESH
ncbi:hypothetical protein BOTBODRAFT_38751 [Botryobasidium botryosum FD-172 SS1]|uniref:non-specific serine/threonine protein kinase n=1 Tax=Botryobasidium botryosum (strain FD-172 SS1) TaxID=930990 RepID=A0A067M7I9_BOTB1|nr:hypothetical protein BOTBODRAFT_38751 [Botryobasidium botryosum FD-172 SS1]